MIDPDICLEPNENISNRLIELLKITQLLTTEKDIDSLLELILLKSRELTSADAGSLYVVETDADGFKKLRFKLSQNDSVALPDADFFIDISKESIAGSVALDGTPLVIEDAYHMPSDLDFKHSTDLDKKIGYETHSILTAPMITHRKAIIGVIQLINKKRHFATKLQKTKDYQKEVLPFAEEDKDLLLSLASQAAIALDNVKLYDEVRTMFNGVVDASVHAIEQRDPTTSGHSRRVCLLTLELAKCIDKVDQGPYATTFFESEDLEELKIAALLHDFGKIGVKETVLTKASKLQPLNLELIETRLDKILYYEESRHLQRVIEAMKINSSADFIQQLKQQWHSLKNNLMTYKETIRKANEPTILPEGDFKLIDEISKLTFYDDNERPIQLLSEHEVECLKIRRGTLTVEEMEEIQSHARKTHEFLQLIPWGSRFKDLPLIAGAHHERLDGSGYPYGLKDSEIPVQSKIMAISDIFDALTASDRPYKKAVPVDRALDILGYEVKDKHLDPELVKHFIKQKIYQVVFPNSQE